MSRDDVDMFEKRKKCRSSPYQQQPHIQYCLSWKAAERGTSPGSNHHFGMSRPHSVMLTSSKQVPLCHRNDTLNTTKSKLRSEASKNFMFSQRSLPGIDCCLKLTYTHYGLHGTDYKGRYQDSDFDGTIKSKFQIMRETFPLGAIH